MSRLNRGSRGNIYNACLTTLQGTNQERKIKINVVFIMSNPLWFKILSHLCDLDECFLTNVIKWASCFFIKGRMICKFLDNNASFYLCLHKVNSFLHWLSIQDYLYDKCNFRIKCNILLSYSIFDVKHLAIKYRQPVKHELSLIQNRK